MPASGAPRRPGRLLLWTASEADPLCVTLRTTPHTHRITHHTHTRHSVGFTLGDSITHLISSPPNLAWLSTSVLSCRSVSDRTAQRHGSNSDRHGMAWQRFLVHYYIFCGARREARGWWVICLFFPSPLARLGLIL